MNIRTKIFLSFIAVIIFNSAAVAFIFLNLERQRRIARELPTFFALEEMNSKLLSKLFEAITTLDENKFKEAKDISANIKENLSKVGSVGFLSETTELTKSIDDYMNTFEKAIKGDENAFSILQEKKLTLDKDWNSLRSSVSKKIESATSRIFAISLLTLPLIIIVGILASILISRNITVNLYQVIRILSEIAKGGTNLKFRIKTQSKDEIGELARNFNLFIESLTKIILGILESSDKVKALSSKAEETYSHILENTRKVGRYIAEVQSSSEVIFEQAESISNKAAGILASSNTSLEKAKTEIQTISENIEMFRKIGELFSNLSKEAEQLKKKEKEISQYVSTINDMAGNIHILALNASIEAGRAGEKAKGFTIVADEVRKLANVTKDIAQKIEKTVSSLVQTISSLTQTIKQVGEQMNVAMEKSQRSIAGLREIEQISKRSVDMINEISSSIEQVRATMRESLNRITEINIFTQDTINEAEDFKKLINLLLESAEDLKKLVGKFEF
jgi:methyl-accepting chemotaxis protein